ncbi:MAG: TonB-dependent receptor [Bacteroidia bacterium]|nr:TonB-dependent receptor [Bacteroidia bacterium]MDW8346730.1 TonB-dependent receptor [Bacteroidia bacterium]
MRINPLLLWVLLLPHYMLLSQQDTAWTTSPIIIIDTSYQKYEGTTTTLFADSLGNYQNNGLQLQDALIHLNSVYIRSYGSHSGIKTFSLRGLASNQTNVVIAGIPLQSAQQGSFNLANFSLDDFEQISVSQGSSDIHSNTLSGNIELNFTRPTYKVKCKLGLGSFENYFGHISVPLKKQKNNFSKIQLRYEQARDNYPFVYQNQTFYRENAQFRQYQANAVWVREHKKWTFTIYSKAYTNDNGVPDAIVHNHLSSTQKKLQEQDTWTMFKIKKVDKKGFQEIGASYHFNHLGYLTPLVRFKYVNHDLLLQYQAGYLYKRHYVKMHVQGLYAHLEGDNLSIRLQRIPFVYRSQVNGAVSHAYTWQKDRATLYCATFQTAYRINFISDFSPMHNVSCYANLFLYKKQYLYANLSYTARIPSFNEMYYFGYGNPDILPERTQNMQIGYSGSIDKLRQVLYKAELFYHIIHDKIVSIPQNPVIWSTYSIGKVISKGFEVDVQYQPHKSMVIHYGYTRTDARDALTKSLLPYTPVEMIKLQAQYQFFKVFTVQGAYQYNGYRFSSVQNDRSSYLEPYHILDFNITYRMRYCGQGIQVRIDINNLLNVQYEVIKGYVMPRRSYVLSFLWACPSLRSGRRATG